MPYGCAGSPDDPKSGCSLVVAPFIPAIHAALRACTGRSVMSAFHQLSAGNIGHVDAPGRGVPAWLERVAVNEASRTPTTTTPRDTRRTTAVLSARLQVVLTILEE